MFCVRARLLVFDCIYLHFSPLRLHAFGDVCLHLCNPITGISFRGERGKSFFSWSLRGGSRFFPGHSTEIAILAETFTRQIPQNFKSATVKITGIPINPNIF